MADQGKIKMRQYDGFMHRPEAPHFLKWREALRAPRARIGGSARNPPLPSGAMKYRRFCFSISKREG